MAARAETQQVLAWCSQGSIILAKTLSIRYYTYYIILGINTTGIMGLWPTDRPTEDKTNRGRYDLRGLLHRWGRKVGLPKWCKKDYVPVVSMCSPDPCGHYVFTRVFTQALNTCVITHVQWWCGCGTAARGQYWIILDNTVWWRWVLGIIRIIFY